LGIIFLIAGVGAICFAAYINKQLNEGRAQVAGAQQKVDVGTYVLGMDSNTKRASQPLTNHVQEQINEGKMTIAQYEKMVVYLQAGGGAAILVGIVFLFLSFGKRKD
jgi:hypothetical protein